MSRASLALTLVSLLSPTFTAIAEPIGAESAGEWSIVQPAEGRGELYLMSRPGRARIERRDGAGGVVLRSGEQLTTIAEVRGGWVAAGARSVEDGQRLVVMTDDSQGLRRLPVPEPRQGALRVRPRLLVRDNELDGLAWLEGDGPRDLRVRVSDWSGIDWGPVRTLSATRRGSQTGLTGATLAGGERLLLWSAFDGRDDEIVFSLDEGGGWTPPRRLAAGNRVPDVAPTVLAAGDGALAAWNRLEGGGYVLVLARWADDGWEELGALAGEDGLFPELLRIDGRILLLYRGVEPRGWGVLELDENGRILRRAAIDSDTGERPAVRLDGAAGISLRWAPRAVAGAPWSVP